MTCQKKNKKLLAYCLLLLLCSVVVTPLLLSVNSYASETTTQSVTDYFREHNFYDTCAYVCRKYASFPYLDYLTGSSSGITYDAWADYLESQGKSDLLNEDVIINNASGGRGYDIPQDVRQELVNFVSEVYIAENPLGFTECYICSYNFLDPTIFPNYQSFINTKELIKNFDGYTFISGMWDYGSNGKACNICQVSRNGDFAFIGTTTEGSFTNVRPYVAWNAISPQLTRFYINTARKEVFNTQCNLVGTRNVSSFNQNYYTVFTNYDKNELVYVFESLNAYKMYNAGQPQSYYMPSNSQLNVPYYDGFTDSQLASAGNFYNNIVINTEGQTPTNIKKTTDSVLGSLDGLFGGGDDTSNGGGLLGGLTDIITGATGAISPIKEIVLGDIKALIEDTFSWLPPTIITIWIAGITFGVFFGVLKLIRG